MLDTALATLNPMAMLFLCIIIGFVLRKTKILPENAGKVMAKMETWVFCPALSFYTMATFFTVESVTEHCVNMLFASFSVGLAIGIAIPLSCLFIKNKSYERGVYQYALTFGNTGYVGDPVVLALFGAEALAYYKMFCLPLSIVIYTWGLNVLTPKDSRSGSSIKKLANPPTVALFIGIIFGLLGITQHLPTFLLDTASSLRGCVGPVGMLLAGVTIANYDVIGMLRNKKVYVATFLRLIVLPSVIISVSFGLKMLINSAFSLSIGNNVLYYMIFAYAAPLGMNTIVFPEAFGGDPKTGSSMVMISHTLCVITIPVMCALATEIFGAYAI